MRKWAILGLLALWPVGSWAAENLVVNGSFDHPGNPLFGWQTKYENNTWYAENHTYVSVVPEDRGRKTVLRMTVPTEKMSQGQGVLTDSQPIAIQPGGRFQFSAWARATGTWCRLYIEGYKWRPNIPKHDHPTRDELRKVYKFKPLYCQELQAGEWTTKESNWRRGTMTFPDKDLTPIAKKKFAEVEFLVVHIAAIGGTPGDVFIDDVVLERKN